VGSLGMLVLSGAGFSGEAATAPNRLLGNVLFTVSLFCEASVTAAGGRLAGRYPASHSVLAMKAAGFVTATAFFAATIVGTDFNEITWKGWASVLYLASFSSVVCYTLWYRVIKVVPVSHVALSLFIQPIVGTVIGYTLLGETVGYETVLGGLLICASLAWWQVRALRATHTALVIP
jgi:drug/metabolite transporter (DMT)-like permease